MTRETRPSRGAALAVGVRVERGMAGQCTQAGETRKEMGSKGAG